jgi:hypothetical protein
VCLKARRRTSHTVQRIWPFGFQLGPSDFTEAHPLPRERARYPAIRRPASTLQQSWRGKRGGIIAGRSSRRCVGISASAAVHASAQGEESAENHGHDAAAGCALVQRDETWLPNAAMELRLCNRRVAAHPASARNHARPLSMCRTLACHMSLSHKCHSRSGRQADPFCYHRRVLR